MIGYVYFREFDEFFLEKFH